MIVICNSSPLISLLSIKRIDILKKLFDKKITIINSFVLEDENSKNLFIDRKNKIYDLLKVALEYVSYSEELENRAKEIERFGIMAMDALHIACAEMAKADFFVTCDDLLVQKGKSNKENINVRIMSLMEFMSILGKENKK